MRLNILIRCYEELNDFLPKERHRQDIEVSMKGAECVKDVIEKLGVPHTEVDLILVNGNPVSFSHVLKDGDRVSVYPVFEAFDISNVTKLRTKPLRSPKFILDNSLGELAKHLMAFGLDVSYCRDNKPLDIINLSLTEKRTILTRSKKLLLKKNVVRGYLVRNRAPEQQYHEVVKRFDLASMIDSL
ncbi:MAG: MoaD/ThiS family protein [Desulfobacterales bacterium]|nr:MAG: MoaD/ThiS family protein [Desulfobacterales bacterium]UCD88963.1 MAG: MoaD/ThiS family protein [Desulfobacterales bacterium]